MQHITMKTLPESERPYEKFLHYGAESLSDAELLAIILRSGTRDTSAVECARSILAGSNGNLLNLFSLSFEEMQQFPGIGQIKAMQLKAAAELSVRITTTERVHHLNLDNPSSIADYYMEQMRHLPEEHLFCAFFDGKFRFLGDAEISVGSVNRSMICPREIFLSALEKKALFLVLLHNHPSGDPSPSEEDILATEEIAKGSRLLGLELADHIIIGDNCHYSFQENNLLSES